MATLSAPLLATRGLDILERKRRYTVAVFYRDWSKDFALRGNMENLYDRKFNPNSRHGAKDTKFYF